MNVCTWFIELVLEYSDWSRAYWSPVIPHGIWHVRFTKTSICTTSNIGAARVNHLFFILQFLFTIWFLILVLIRWMKLECWVFIVTPITGVESRVRTSRRCRARLCHERLSVSYSVLRKCIIYNGPWMQLVVCLLLYWIALNSVAVRGGHPGQEVAYAPGASTEGAPLFQ